MTATLQHLESLARERSSDKRRALLRAISDCFFASAEHSPSEIALYSEVVTRVLDEVEPIARAELAERMADLVQAPHRVVLLLARDEIIVAKPVLTRSLVLNDSDLEGIALNQSQPHLAAIAMRATLSERVTDVLVSRGDQQVVGTVVANHGARFSQHGFATLAERATADEMLLDRLGTRMDMPAEIAQRLGPLISGALAAKLKAAGAVPAMSTLKGLAEQSQAVLTSRLRSARVVGRSLDIILDEVERGVLKIDAAVAELADIDATPDVAKLMAGRVDLRADTVTRALCAPADQPVALLCRGAGLTIDGYGAIVKMRRRRRRGSDGPAAKLIEQYREIPLPTAQRVLRFLKVRETAGSQQAGQNAPPVS